MELSASPGYATSKIYTRKCSTNLLNVGLMLNLMPFEHVRYFRQSYRKANMASLRRVALNLVRREQSHPISLRQKRRLCGLDEHSLLTVLSGAT